MRIFGTIEDSRTEKPVAGAIISIYNGDTCLVKNTPSSSDGKFNFQFEGTSQPIPGSILKCTIKRKGYRTQNVSYAVVENDLEINFELKPRRIKWRRVLIISGIILGVLLILGILAYFLFFRPAPPPPLIKSFSSDTLYIAPGDTAILKWETENASRVHIGEEKADLAGTKKVNPNETTTYTLTASNKKGKEVKRTLKINVPPPPQIVSFGASPVIISRGDPVLLQWETANAEGVYITDAAEYESDLNKTIKEMNKNNLENPANETPDPRHVQKGELNGSVNVFPQDNMIYTLVVFNKAGVRVKQRVKITVVFPPEINYFIASHTVLPETGGTTTLNWKTTSADKVTLNGEETGLFFTKEVAVEKTTQFVLIAKNAAGERRSALEVIVPVKVPVDPVKPPQPGPDPKITRYLISPTVIAPGQTCKAEWTTENANEVFLNGNKVEPNGSKILTPARSITYEIKAVNKDKKEVTWVRTVEVKPTPFTVILYQYENYRGKSREFTNDTSNIGTLDNSVGSIKIIGDCTVEVYSAPRYKGTRQVFTESAPRLRGTWIGMNTISSLKFIRKSTAQ